MAQTILVTGSTSGFGRLTVETLARQGHIVFAGMRAAAGKNAPAAEELRALAERERLALHIVEIDITDESSVEQAIESIIATTGRIDVVVNNAGMSIRKPPQDYAIPEWQAVLETNLTGAFACAQAVYAPMKQGGGGGFLFCRFQDGLGMGNPPAPPR